MRAYHSERGGGSRRERRTGHGSVGGQKAPHGAAYPQASCASASASDDQLNHRVIFITSRLTHSMRSSMRTKGVARPRRA